MKVYALFFEPLRSVAGGREVTVVLKEEARVADLLDQLARQCRGDLGTALADSPTLRIIVNGQDIAFLGGAEAALRDGDNVVFLTAVGGGCQGMVVREVSV